MVDRPIIFSAPMVLALLAGRKTQTRRLVKPPKKWAEKYPLVRTDVLVGELWCWDGVHDRVGASFPMPYAPGDRLWVRENCWSDYQGSDGNGVRYQAGGAWIKATDEERWAALDCYAHTRHPDNATNTGQRVPAIHMPRWASRITLTVTDVRVQPLLDISEEDAMAEGFEAGTLDDAHGPRDIGGGWSQEHMGTRCSAAGAFQILWQKLHPDWDGFSSPHVVALTFAVEQRNIDAT